MLCFLARKREASLKRRVPTLKRASDSGFPRAKARGLIEAGGWAGRGGKRKRSFLARKREASLKRVVCCECGAVLRGFLARKREASLKPGGPARARGLLARFLARKREASLKRVVCCECGAVLRGGFLARKREASLKLDEVLEDARPAPRFLARKREASLKRPRAGPAPRLRAGFPRAKARGLIEASSKPRSSPPPSPVSSRESARPH